MAVKIGISLIAWQNDDLPELTKDYTTEGAMEDAGRIGYSGVERGRRMPGDSEGLRAYLDRYGVSLCGGWCSGSLMANDIETEKEAIRQQVEQFAALHRLCRMLEHDSGCTGYTGVPPPQTDPRRSHGLWRKTVGSGEMGAR